MVRQKFHVLALALALAFQQSLSFAPPVSVLQARACPFVTSGLAASGLRCSQKCKARAMLRPLIMDGSDYIPVDAAKIKGRKRLPIIPIAAGTGGSLFPECKQQISVAGEELVVVRSIEAERLPLFGYCMIGDNGELLPVGTLALVEKVEWSKLTSEEGGLPDEEGNPWTPWGGSDDQSKAIVKCVGVQRFKILSLETREPYPIAHVELFTDENTEHQEPELDEVLSQVENVATKTMTEVLRIGGELVGDIAKAEIEDAKSRMSKFAPGGPGTAQIVWSPVGPMGWQIGERERRELQSFVLADIQNANEDLRYNILECRSTISRFKRVAELLQPQLNKLVAQNSLKKLSLDIGGNT